MYGSQAIDGDPQLALFLTKDGKAFAALSKWYRDLHVSHMAPFPLLTLTSYRSVFVADRMEDPSRAGPSNDGAATLMGNTTRQWEASYWKNKRRKEAKQAAKEVHAYRASHLADAGYVSE